MGCDIHMFAETLNDNGEWEASPSDAYETYRYDDEHEEISQVNTRRNYWLFGVLAEVRAEFPYSFEARGFPEDASELTTQEFKQWGSDAHTPSYLTKHELEVKATELLISSDVGAQEDASDLRELIGKLYGQSQQQRVVFWFDN